MQNIEKIIEEAKRLQFQGDEGDNRNELRRLFGLEGDEEDNNPSPLISDHPEVLECIMPKSYGRPANGGNQILLDSVLDGSLWFSAVCAEGYGHGSGSLPSVFDIPFRSRQEALGDAVAIFYKKLEEFPQNTPREKRLVSVLEKWLKKIEAENGLLNSGDDAPDEEDAPTNKDAAPLVDANGQGLLFPPSEGIPEDFEDEMRKKAKAARAQAEMKKMYADERKKQATMLAKICDREAHFAQVQDVVDEARLTSMKHPETVWLAVDTSDNPRVTDIEEWRSILPKGRASFALYAAWRGGLRLPKKELLALLALPPEDAQGIETSEEAAPAALEEGAAHGATEPGAA